MTFISRNQSRNEQDEAEIAALEQENQGEVEEKELVKEEPKLSPEEASFKKRYGDLQRHMQKKEAENKERMDALETRLNDNKSGTMPKTAEEVEAWVKKYPDVAAIVERLADRTAASRDEKIDARLKQVEQMSEEVSAQKAEAALLKVHPDFNEIKETQEFFDWVDEQPQYIQDSLYGSLDVKSASRAIDLYKADKGIRPVTSKDAAKQVSRSTGSAPSGTSGNSWSESKVQKLGDKDYEKYEGEIMEAIKSGKFSYDISASAR